MHRRSFLKLGLGGTLLLLDGCGGGDSAPAPAPAPPSPPRILLPAYFYDAAEWERALRPRSPGHWIIANVNSGPGTSTDAHFVPLFAKARQRGHVLLGYVATGYGRMPQQTVIDQAKTWKDLYGIEHLFLDEVRADGAGLPYYRSLVTALRQQHPGATILLNPGTVPLEDYFRLDADVDILIFENRWSVFSKTNFPAWLEAWWTRSHLIVHGAPVDALPTIYRFARDRQMRGFFISDARDAIYHEGLPSYWEMELAL